MTNNSRASDRNFFRIENRFYFYRIIESGVDAQDKQCFHFYSSSHSIQVWAVTFCFVAAGGGQRGGRGSAALRVGSRSVAASLDLRQRSVARPSVDPRRPAAAPPAPLRCTTTYCITREHLSINISITTIN